jgi:ribosomal protein S18 acetylase RimI-like enzyme
VSTVALEFRPARESDVPAITAVHDEAWRLAYRGMIPGRELERMVARRGPAWWAAAIRRGSGLMVMRVAGITAGYASFGRNRAPMLGVGGEIYELYVKPEFQGTGCGGRLFAAARQELQARGLRGTAVWALADNSSACEFYRHVGGRPAARGTERFGETLLDKIAFVWD